MVTELCIACCQKFPYTLKNSTWSHYVMWCHDYISVLYLLKLIRQNQISFFMCILLPIKNFMYILPQTWSQLRADLKRFCDKVVVNLWCPAPSPCLQTSRSLNNTSDRSVAHCWKLVKFRQKRVYSTAFFPPFCLIRFTFRYFSQKNIYFAL